MAAQGGLFATNGAQPSREALQAAQTRLMQDHGLQFRFAAAPSPSPPSRLPHWLLDLLRSLGKLGAGLGKGLEWVFIAGLAVALALVLLFIAREIIRTRWPQLLKRKRAARRAALDWRPDAAAARALLEEADRLAAEGAYGEAAHLLLYRSIEDIERHRPRLVRPALTSREIAGLEGLPAAARATFSKIAEIVERSFFGGRDLDAAGFAECRQAYEAFAIAGAWA
ncbi:MAG: hypothetical protein JO127_05890 [Caulobacteraceae bacterium]|nr:hypothetical protein [Caulobacteraceae bacterium]